MFYIDEPWSSEGEGNLRVSVVGMGFVGLTLAVFLASRKIRTIGIETNRSTLDTLRRSQPPFYEKDLEPTLKKVLKSKMLELSDDISDIASTEVTFVCVGTPARADGSMDLAAVTNVAKSIAGMIAKDTERRLVVIKSTVVPTTTDNTIMPILESFSNKKCGKDFDLVVNPEFLREGSAMDDTRKPHLIVMGEAGNSSSKKLRNLYARVYGKQMAKVMITGASTAEMIKYANNSFLATKISFINSIANICKHVPGTDVEQVAEAIGHDPRIGPLFLKAGPGYGGSCFPKDVSALVAFCSKINVDSPLIKATQEVNMRQPYEVTRIVIDRFGGSLEGKKISILGLSFKKDTDDIREAVSLKIIPELLKRGARIRAHDPMATGRVKEIFGDDITYCDSVAGCLDGTDCCVILTEWDEYRKLKPGIFLEHMNTPIVIDARRVLNPQIFEASLEYHAIGRKSKASASR